MSEHLHVYRPPIPWRPDARRTECGRDPAGLDVMERDAFFAQARAWGQQRTYVLACMTCLHTAQRHPTWETSPAAFMGRYVAPAFRQSDADRDLLDRELRAMVALVEAHRAEFEAILALPDLSDLRRARQARRTR